MLGVFGLMPTARICFSGYFLESESGFLFYKFQLLAGAEKLDTVIGSGCFCKFCKFVADSGAA